MLVCTGTIGQQFVAHHQRHDLRITIEVNKKIVNFLNTTLNLSNSMYSPTMKVNSTTLYISSISNHPPSVIKNKPAGIICLSLHASSQRPFDSATAPYQKALCESNFDHKLQYKPTIMGKWKKLASKQCYVVQPPFCKSVETNIGRKFLNLVNKSFLKGHTLRKIFNRNTLKMSYSCMNSVKQIINVHNNKLLQEDRTGAKVHTNANTRNFRKKNKCPLNGKCLQFSVIYQAIMTCTTNNSAHFHNNQCHESAFTWNVTTMSFDWLVGNKSSFVWPKLSHTSAHGAKDQTDKLLTHMKTNLSSGVQDKTKKIFDPKVYKICFVL